MKVLVYNKGCVREDIMTQNLRHKLELLGLEKTYSVREADVIIYITCAGLGDTIAECIKEIGLFNMLKKSDTKIILAGCLTNIPAIMDFYYENEDIKIVKNPDFLVPILNIINDENKRNTLTTRLENRTRGFFNNNTNVQFFLCNGCLNNCTFCKTNYMDEPLTSIPFEIALNHLKNLIKNGTKKITLSGENLTLYGIDLYGYPRLHEFIHELSKTPGLMQITVNEIAAQNMYPELLQELKTNSKVISVSIQIETASNSQLQLMNRAHTLEEYDAIAKPLIDAGKFVKTILMSGFPCETYEDLDTTINYLNDRGIYTEIICKYSDFPLLPSHEFEQLSKREKNEHTRYLRNAIKQVNHDILTQKMENTVPAIYYGKEGNRIYLGNFHVGYSIKKEHQDLELGSVVTTPAKRLVYNDLDHKSYVYRY